MSFLVRFPVFFTLIIDEVVANKIQAIDNLPKALEVYWKLKPVLGGNSMITLEGDHWHRLRKMFNPAFSQGHLETMVPAIVEETLVFVDALNKAAKSREIISMLDALTVSTFLVPD